MLLACVVLAMVWANSAWADQYFALQETEIAIGFGAGRFGKTLLHWINDGFMAVFFFLVGLEIKREVLVGDLAEPRQAVFPLAAAAGGMLAPALVYWLIQPGGLAANGWAIPTATDIAFALGVLSLFGKSLPLSLKVFLTALAIADDIGAILIIGLFYSAPPNFIALAAAFALLTVMAALNRMGARSSLVYGIFAFGVWLAVLKSGVHATLAGVLAAATIPAKPRIDLEAFGSQNASLLASLKEAKNAGTTILANAASLSIIQDIKDSCHRAATPLQQMEHALHPWVSFLILPLFALFNSGVSLNGLGPEALFSGVGLAVCLGLFVGKPVGIFLVCWLVAKTGIAQKPGDMSWSQLFGVACLGGIGFTMSLFMASLSLSDNMMLDSAKLGILMGSFLSATAGSALLAAGIYSAKRRSGQSRPGA